MGRLMNASLPEEPATLAQEASKLDRLRHLALRDELTGMANRRACLMHMCEAFSRAGAGGPLVSLVLLDMDRLKDINDTIGYEAGDAALREFALALTSVIRAGDLVARIGGAARTGQVARPSAAAPRSAVSPSDTRFLSA